MAHLLSTKVIPLIAFYAYLSNAKIFHYQPEQIHLSLGGKLGHLFYFLKLASISVESVSDIVVTWSTMDNCDSVVEYGIRGFALSATGSTTEFVDGGPEKHTQYIHRVVLKDLSPGEKYGTIT